MNRRHFLEMAGAFSATLAWGRATARSSTTNWGERRDLFPQGVAAGDPHPDSVLLWTRRPPVGGNEAKQLTLEVASDPQFTQVVATATAQLSQQSDWTCRVLAAGLKPASVYWYRYTDEHGHGSRIGRTITAPRESEARAVHFAFVSCQDVCQGAQNAYRRMIFEDERKPRSEQLDFVLHLGDFVYEVVWYPEDGAQRGRRLRDVVRFKDGEKVRDFHIPVTLDDYRALYRGYLQDPDLQDARARWPFICVWDNHEFSWRGWQGFMNVTASKPAQTRKVAANQAWFEYQPARVVQPGNDDLARFAAPAVVDAPVERFDEQGLGLEPNNRAAIDSLIIYRRLRYGRNVDLMLTDNRSFQMECALSRPEADVFASADHLRLIPEEVIDILDAGRNHDGGRAPDTIRFGAQQVANARKNHPSQTMLGEKQKTWLLEQLRASGATWKIWGNSMGTLDWRTDPQNLPADAAKPWPGAGYGCMYGSDWSGYRTERAEIFDFVRDQRITGFAIVAGDRHSFWAGRAAKALPPRKFEPVAVEFITGSVSSPGLAESAERIPKEAPLSTLFVHRPASGGPPQRTANMLLLHGVRSCLEYAKSGDHDAARRLSNPNLAPHLQFLDLGGHGYATVAAHDATLDVEFVCIPRPLERSEGADGGPLAYRVTHRTKLWKAGEAPQLQRVLVEGTLPLSI